MEKKDYLKGAIEHIDIKRIDATEIVEAMKKMSFTSRDLARAAEIYDMMLATRIAQSYSRSPAAQAQAAAWKSTPTW